VPVRLLYLVSHPIQYQAPLLQLIAADPDIDLLVLFEDLKSSGTYTDPGFGHDVTWDVPLTDGYSFAELKTGREISGHLEQCDVLWVHGWNSKLIKSAIKAASKAGIPVLMRGENTAAAMPDGGFPRGIIKRAYLNSIFRHCTGFLCVGSDNRQYYRDHGIDDGRLFSMPYTVDNDFFRDSAKQAGDKREEFRQELGLEADRPVVLYAGKLQARKHPSTLLAAFRGLDMEIARHPYLLYVGDGEQRSDLETQSKDMGDRVRILGFKNQTELPAYYNLADVFVLASEREPWGLAVNEAMNAGTAIIASDQCGSAADLIDDTCGRVIKSGDAVALRGALSDVLCDRRALEKMGQNAAAKISGWGLNESHQGLKQALIRLTLLSA
jgi:glycosyltransferase involved in cell wall biosynthesis